MVFHLKLISIGHLDRALNFWNKLFNKVWNWSHIEIYKPNINSSKNKINVIVHKLDQQWNVHQNHDTQQ